MVLTSEMDLTTSPTIPPHHQHQRNLDHPCAVCVSNVKHPRANAILEQVHQVIMMMLLTAEIDKATSVAPSDIATFLTNVAWAIHSIYHSKVLKASPGAAIFGRDICLTCRVEQNWRLQAMPN